MGVDYCGGAAAVLRRAPQFLLMSFIVFTYADGAAAVPRRVPPTPDGLAVGASDGYFASKLGGTRGEPNEVNLPRPEDPWRDNNESDQ